MHCIGIQASAGLSSSIIGLAGQPRMFALKLYGGKNRWAGRLQRRDLEEGLLLYQTAVQHAWPGCMGGGLGYEFQQGRLVEHLSIIEVLFRFSVI